MPNSRHYGLTGLWQKAFRGGAVAFLVLLFTGLAGCVTSTDSSLSSKANAERAERAYVQLGLAYIARDRLSEARSNLNRALEINPESAPALAAKGLIFQEQGEEKLAEEYFRKALDVNPDFTRGRTYYGAFLYAQNRFQDAYEQFSRASQDTGFNDRAQVFYNLALCAMRLGLNDEAIEAYRKALNIRGDTFTVLSGMAWLLVNTGRYDEASTYYRRLERILKTNPEAEHTPRSLLTGIQLAQHVNDQSRVATLALLLRNLYPESSEYRQYKASIADD